MQICEICLFESPEICASHKGDVILIDQTSLLVDAVGCAVSIIPFSKIELHFEGEQKKAVKNVMLPCVVYMQLLFG